MLSRVQLSEHVETKADHSVHQYLYIIFEDSPIKPYEYKNKIIKKIKNNQFN